VRKIAATYVFPGNGSIIKNGILVCNDKGKILEILDRGANFKEEAGVEFYSGILVPGFVNTHCHLELSHLQNKVPEKAGIGNFLQQIHSLRKTESSSEKVMQVSDRKMWAAGIAAVGDISNTDASLPIKAKSKIYYHTFIEVFGFHPTRAERAFLEAQEILSKFEKSRLSASIVPHSGYSVSPELFKKVQQHTFEKESLFCIHNQESKAESAFFLSGTGAIAKHFSDNLNLETNHWQPTGKSSLQSILQFIPKNNQLLLVHNTHTTKEDIEAIKQYRKLADTYFVLCPNSNLFIENKIPNLQLFREEKLNICLGTDSLASNSQLSILQEIQVLQQNFPEIELDELITWSCLNGARALQIENAFGSFDKGKTPGVNLITGIDFRTMKLRPNAKVKRLL